MYRMEDVCRSRQGSKFYWVAVSLWAVRNMLISHSTRTMKRVELLLFHSDHDGCWHRGTDHFCLADMAFAAGRSSCCELPLEEVSEVCNCWNLKLTELPIIDIDSPVTSSMCWSCFVCSICSSQWLRSMRIATSSMIGHLDLLLGLDRKKSGMFFS